MSPVESGFPPLNQSAVAWGDFDNDGYLDLLISGSNDEHGLHSGLHRNAGDGTFADIQAGLPGLRWSSVAWADYDNDGDLDFILCGMNDATSSAVSSIYRNDGGTHFVDIHANLPGVYQGAAAWSDFDGDGDQDLVLTGNSNDQIPISRLYRNDGGGLFAEMAVEFPGVTASSVACGDYDNDGNSDLLLTGWDGGTFLTHLFRNHRGEAGSIFIDATGSLPGISAGSVAWGDHDNDGDLDLLMAGWSGTYSARIFRNDGVNGFVDASAEFAGVNWASAAWADFDNDGDLDALVSGSTANTRICHLYRNEVGVPNSQPGVPGNLNAVTVGNTATISWNPANDPSANSPLSYNVALRSKTGGLELAAHMSDPATGFRRVPRIGNAGDNLSLTFKDLKPGTYEFTVQAIDSALTGGPFAPVQTMEVLPLPVAIVGVEIPTAGEFRLQIGAPAGSACQVFRSFDLSAWTAIGSAEEVSPGEFEFLDGAAPENGAFYRIEASTP